MTRKAQVTSVWVMIAVVAAIAIGAYVIVNAAPIVKFPVTGDIVARNGDELQIAALDIKHPDTKIIVNVYLSASTTIEALEFMSSYGTTTQQIVSQSVGAGALSLGERVSVVPIARVDFHHIVAAHITILPNKTPHSVQ